MAAPELHLQWLAPLGSSQWAYQNIVFDFTMMVDRFVRPWAIQGIETGIQAAASAPAIDKEMQSMLAGGRSRTIRFFDNMPGFLANTRVDRTPGTSIGTIGPSGASFCAESFSAERVPGYVPTAPEARTDLRMFLNPTGGTGMSLPLGDGSYHPVYSYLVGTLWHEFHHMAAPDTEQHGLDSSPPYEPRWQTAMAAIRAGFPAMAWDPVARALVPLLTNQWAAIPCMCGRFV